MKKTDLLNLETRRKIFNYIEDNPGLHLRKIARELGINYHNLRYHLRYLERKEVIIIKESNSYARVYSNNIGAKDKDLLNIIRERIPSYITLFLFMYGTASQKDLSENLDLHPTTVEYHLKKLLNKKIIEPATGNGKYTYVNFNKSKLVNKSPKINEKLYRLIDPAEIDKIFITNKQSLFFDKIFKTGLTILSETVNKCGIPKKIKRMDEYIDSTINLVFDIFPVPFTA